MYELKDEQGKQYIMKLLHRLKPDPMKFAINKLNRILRTQREYNEKHNNQDYPHMLRLYSYTKTEARFCVLQKCLAILMEYIHGKNLLDYVKEKKKMSKNEVYQLIRNAIDSIAFIHKEFRSSHLDIKIDNFMLDNKRNIVLIDVDQLHSVKDDHVINGKHEYICKKGFFVDFSPYYLPKNAGKTVDEFSLGIVIYYILKGYEPHDKNNFFYEGIKERMENFTKNIKEFHPFFNDKETEFFYQLVSGFFEEKPCKRTTAGDAMKNFQLFCMSVYKNSDCLSKSKIPVVNIDLSEDTTAESSILPVLDEKYSTEHIELTLPHNNNRGFKGFSSSQEFSIERPHLDEDVYPNRRFIDSDKYPNLRKFILSLQDPES